MLKKDGIRPITEKRIQVVGLGLNSIDTIVTIERGYPRWGQKTEVRGTVTLPGGQVATSMVGLQRLGKQTLYIGKVGSDPQGIALHQALEDEGVNCGALMIQGETKTQSAVITVQRQTGDRTVLWEHDPKLRIRTEELHREIVTAGDILHVDGCDTEAAIQAAQWADQENMVITADFDTRYKDLDVLLPLVHFPILSEQLAGELTSLWPEPEKRRRGDQEVAGLEQIAQEYNLSFVAVTLGERGVLALENGEAIRVPGFNLQKMAKPETYQTWEYDTIGAGDAFRTGFIYALLHGSTWDLAEKLRIANAVAALNCLRRGAWAGLPTEKELLEFLGKNAVLPDLATT